MAASLVQIDVDPLDALAARIRTRQATAAVVGLGYVGLPLLVGIGQAGFTTIGVDVRALVNTAAMVFDARGVTAGLDAANVVRL